MPAACDTEGIGVVRQLALCRFRWQISILRDTNGDNVTDETSRDIITGLYGPHLSLVRNNGIVFGKDGRMWFSAVGSTTACLRKPIGMLLPYFNRCCDGSDLRTYAVGGSKPYRLAFNSEAGLLQQNGPMNLSSRRAMNPNHIVGGCRLWFLQKYFANPPPNSGTVPPPVALSRCMHSPMA